MMLIRRAELEGGRRADVRIAGGRITAIGTLEPLPGEAMADARGGLLLPGLHDHHIHVAALAASLGSVACGPPRVCDEAGFAAALRGVAGSGWLRGVGYHESVAGLPDAALLDEIVADRPVRIQHRSGRMWFLNSAALDLLLTGRGAPDGLERIDGRATGRLFDADAWLRQGLGSIPPDFGQVGTLLARRGVTGLTDMTPANDGALAAHFAAQHERGALAQHVLLAGAPGLAHADMQGVLELGPTKLHLHENALPEFDTAVAMIGDSHRRGRAVAVHCATEVELVFALAAIDAAGALGGDRIEHASVSPDTAVAEIARLGLAVCSQPHFIAERGDAYRAEIAPGLHPILYRLRAFRDAGVPLAGGSDAPFGGTDPWAAMAAAVSRRTREGAMLGAGEALVPEAALDLYLRDSRSLDGRRRIAVGAPADLCLIDRPWSRAREDLAAVDVRATWIDGRLVFDGVDQSPAERVLGADPPA